MKHQKEKLNLSFYNMIDNFQYQTQEESNQSNLEDQVPELENKNLTDDNVYLYFFCTFQ